MFCAKRITIIGGGPAGVFAAIRAREKGASVLLLEKSSSLLQKLLLSGGGRCNLTHTMEDLRSFTDNFPRGGQELMSSFSRFSSSDLMEWFFKRGIALKIEKDGRVFPKSNSSRTIYDCLYFELHKLSIEIRWNVSISHIEKRGEKFTVFLENAEVLSSDFLLIATGSSQEGFAWASSFGHQILSPLLLYFLLRSFPLP